MFSAPHPTLCFASQMQGVNVEAVLRVEEDEENGGMRKNKSSQREAEEDLGLSMLIDSQNNQYVLTKPRDSTMPRADHHFIKVSPTPAVTKHLICHLTGGSTKVGIVHHTSSPRRAMNRMIRRI